MQTEGQIEEIENDQKRTITGLLLVAEQPGHQEHLGNQSEEFLVFSLRARRQQHDMVSV